MRTVNALTIRNRLGEVLEHLEQTNEPVLISKGREIRAALVPIEEFKTRFVDRLAEEERRERKKQIVELRGQRVGRTESLEVLRALRGYPK